MVDVYAVELLDSALVKPRVLQGFEPEVDQWDRRVFKAVTGRHYKVAGQGAATNAEFPLGKILRSDDSSPSSDDDIGHTGDGQKWIDAEERLIASNQVSDQERDILLAVNT